MASSFGKGNPEKTDAGREKLASIDSHTKVNSYDRLEKWIYFDMGVSKNRGTPKSSICS